VVEDDRRFLVRPIMQHVLEIVRACPCT
jgi:hypothetical protein